MSSTSKGGSGLGTSTKMCKSPKNSSGIYQKPDSTSSSNLTSAPSYESLNTNCTVVGSNNLHLLKKNHQHVIQQPQQVHLQVQSPIYSNASPIGGMVFPTPTSPYMGGGGTISPAPVQKGIGSPSLGVKSPQPTQTQVLTAPQQNYSVMQIIHNPLIGRPIQSAQQPPPQNIIKLKPHLNILPKPATIHQVPRSSVSPHQQLLTIPSVSPTTLPTHNQQHTLLSAHQPAANQPPPIIINQLPTHAMLTAAGQLQFILRPATAAAAHQTTTHAPPQHVPVSIANSANIQSKQLGHLTQQQLNGLLQLQQQQQLATLQLPPPPPPPALVGGRCAQAQQVIQQVHLQAAGASQQAGQQMVRLMTNGLTSGSVVQGIMQQQAQTGTTFITTQNHIQPPVNISPKKKPKKKKQKLDLANIMKLSGIGDDDDVQFESDTSQSEGEPNSHSQSNTPQPQISVMQSSQSPAVVNTATSAAAAAAAVQAAAVQAHAFQQHQQQQLVQNQMLQPATLATLLQSLQQQQQVQAAHKQQLGNIQIPTVQTAAPNIVQLLSNQSFTTTPSGLVTPTTSTPHILSIPTSSAALTAQHHPAATQQSIPAFAAAHSTAGGTTAGPTTAGFTLNGATAATLQRAAAAAAAAAGQNLGAAGGGASTTTLPVPVTGLGGFKLALGEDGRLVLQHDPGLQQQQDLQSQLLLQTIFGLSGGGLLLQPTTIDQQVHSQTVQTIQQQQTVQTIQQQTVQSQTVQHHSLQTIQQTIQPQIQAQTVQQTIHHHHHHQVQQPVAPSQVQQVQPIQSVQTQQQQQQQQAVSGATTMQLVQPQTIQQLLQQQQHMQNQSQVMNGIAVSPVPASSPVQQHHHHHQHHVVNSIAPLPQPIGIGHGHNHHHQPVLKVQPFQKSQPAAVAPQSAPNTTPSSPISSTSTAPPTSYVVNLTPDQLEQLKRNGQLTVNGQTIFMQRPQQVSEATGAHIGNGNSGGTATMTSTIGAGGVQVDHKVSMQQQMGGAMGVCQSMVGGQMKLTPKTIKRKSGCNKILGNKDLTALNVGTPAHPHMTTIAAHSTVYTNQQSAVNSHIASKGITGNSNIDKVINTVVREAAKSAGLMNSAANVGSGVQKLQHQIMSTNKQVPTKKSPNQIRPLILSPKQNTTKNNQSTTTIAPPQSVKQTTASNTTRSLPNIISPTQTAATKDQSQSNNQEVVDRLLGQIIEESQQQKVAMPSAKSITTTKTTTAAPSNATVSNGPSVTTNSLLTASACGNQNNKLANTGQQRVHTIQLTPQQQQYLKSIQLQIQTLNARGQQSGSNGDVEVQNALKVLFLEQQKILASGKLLPPDKVFYHNNQIIVNTGSGSAPTVLSTSGLTVVQPPPGKGLEALGINLGGGGQMQHQTVVTKADVGTSTNGCGGITNSTNVGNKSNHQQPQSNPIGSTTHHPVNCNIAKSIQQTSLPDSSTTQQSASKLPSLPSLHPLQQINIPVSSSTNSTLAHNLQQQQQSVGQAQALVVQLNQSNSSQADSTACSIVNTLGSTKVPRPILPRLPVQQQQNAKQPSTISSAVSIVNSESVTNCNAVINQNQLVSVSQQSGVQICQQIKNSSKAQLVQQQPVQQPLTGYMKAQRIEQQLTSDQSGAVNPDIQTPFRDKADACQRLLRYHCYDQPVLSEKDLSKADEIFELTARHFIDKFGRMVDKYRYLLLKEGQRHVQTSELMMLDRMFLAEEQQSLIKLRQDIEEGNFDALLPNDQKENHSEPSKNIYKEQQCVVQERQEQEVQLIDLDIADKLQTTVIDNDSVVGSLNELSDDELDDNLEEKDDEEYDEWQCIQRELGCLAAAATTPPTSVESINQHCINIQTSSNSKLLQTNTNSNSSNCSNSSSTSSSSCFSSASGFGKRLSNNIGNNEPIKRYKGTRIPEDSSAPSSAITTATHCSSFSANSTANTTNNTDEMDNSGSIDEQVQSAIDSILNLQQTSGIVTSQSKNDADRLGIS